MHFRAVELCPVTQQIPNLYVVDATILPVLLERAKLFQDMASRVVKRIIEPVSVVKI